jgi:hypothetical protein
LEIAKIESRYVATAEADRFLHHLATLQRAVLIQKLERELPGRIEGKTTGEKQVLGRQIADEICDIMQSLLAAANKPESPGRADSADPTEPPGPESATGKGQ